MGQRADGASHGAHCAHVPALKRRIFETSGRCVLYVFQSANHHANSLIILLLYTTEAAPLLVYCKNSSTDHAWKMLQTVAAG